MKNIRFKEAVDYGGFIPAGTTGTLNEEKGVLAIPARSYGGFVLLGSNEARFEWPISVESGYGDIASKIEFI